jgi:hypothetical protein
MERIGQAEKVCLCVLFTPLARQFDGTFDSLRPAIGEKQAPIPGSREKFLGKLHLRLLHIVIGKVDVSVDLTNDSFLDTGMIVSERVNRQPTKEVEIAFSLAIVQVTAVAPFDVERKSFVRWEEVLMFFVED